MQQLDVYFQKFLNMFRASLCPPSGEQDYVTACGVLRCNKRGKLDISLNVFFVWYCVVNLDGISCVYENVVCKLVVRGVGLVYVSCVFQVWCTHDTYTSPTPRHTNLHTTFSYTHEIPSRFTTQYLTKKTLKLISNFPRLLQRSTPHAVTYVLFS